MTRVGLLSACGPETLPCSEDGPPRRGDEDLGLSEGKAEGAMLAQPKAKFLRPPPPNFLGEVRGEPLGKGSSLCYTVAFPPNVTQSSPFYSLRSVRKNKSFLSTAPRVS